MEISRRRLLMHNGLIVSLLELPSQLVGARLRLRSAALNPCTGLPHLVEHLAVDFISTNTHATSIDTSTWFLDGYTDIDSVCIDIASDSLRWRRAFRLLSTVWRLPNKVDASAIRSAQKSVYCELLAESNSQTALARKQLMRFWHGESWRVHWPRGTRALLTRRAARETAEALPVILNPNNAELFVAGAIARPKGRAIERIEPRDIVPLKRLRRAGHITITQELSESLVMVAVPGAPVGTPMWWSIELIRIVLEDLHSNPLRRNILIDNPIAHSYSCNHNFHLDGGYVDIASWIPSRYLRDWMQCVSAEVKRLGGAGLSLAEFSSAKYRLAVQARLAMMSPVSLFTLYNGWYVFDVIRDPLPTIERLEFAEVRDCLRSLFSRQPTLVVVGPHDGNLVARLYKQYIVGPR